MTNSGSGILRLIFKVLGIGFVLGVGALAIFLIILLEN